jgi:tetratricopeptide (TPR) repeat protein
MKKIVAFILVSTAFVLNVFASTDSLLSANKKLIEARQYAAAYKQLELADRENKQVDIVLAKVDLAINYFATSIMHHFFGFTDLTPDQDLEEIRKGTGKFDLYILKADLLLDSLSKVYPEDDRLNKALGDFYYEVYLRYNDQWIMTTDELLTKLKQNYLKAISGGVADYESYFVLGYIDLGKENYQDAAGYLSQAIKLNPAYPASYYNLAYCLVNLKEYTSAIEYGLAAYEMYDDTMMKADATRLISLAYDENGDTKQAIQWLGKGLKLVPGSFYHLKDLVDICVREDYVQLDSIIVEFYLVAPDNPLVYNTLIDIFYAHKADLKYLISFFREMMPIFPTVDKVQANLYYFTAMLEFESDPVKAKETFLSARTLMRKVYPPEHEVFGIIEKYLNK